MRRIVVAADSFKGALSSLEVAEAFARGFYRVFPHCEVAMANVERAAEQIARLLSCK